ncbi:MAG: flagellar protein FlgN [Ignavibacteriales bacterium]|nr:flagellar protein FlgN [Ignavibacteriales bacterium]
MKTEIIELEKILDQEIQAYSALEKYIIDKKDSLISGNIDQLRSIDTEIEHLNSKMLELESKRKLVNSSIGNENLTLKEIIEKIEKEDKTKAERFSNIRDNMKNLSENIQKQNNINLQLIEHSLKMLENSVTSIAKALMPEMSSYNNIGKKDNSNNISVSSIIREA